MKNKALVLLAAIYLFSTLGVSAQSMYCMGVLRSTQLSYGTPKKADCKMAARMKRCCQTKKQLLKVKDQHDTPGVMDVLAKIFPVLLNFTINNNAPTCAAITTQQQLYYSHAPPGLLKTPAYMLNCNYRV